ncbi:MAG: hypothetical protein Q9199_007392 [Rusavskia elegans]
MREPREMDVEIPLVLERIWFLPIEIPELSKIVPSMAPVLAFSFKDTAPFDLSYGFNASNPPESSINFNLSDLKSSSITGCSVPISPSVPTPSDPPPVQISPTSTSASPSGPASPPVSKFSVVLLRRWAQKVFIDLPKLNVAIDSQPDTANGQYVAAGPSDSRIAKSSHTTPAEGAHN